MKEALLFLQSDWTSNTDEWPQKQKPFSSRVTARYYATPKSLNLPAPTDNFLENLDSENELN